MPSVFNPYHRLSLFCPTPTQILPSRPGDDELAEVELLNFAAMAEEAITQITGRIADAAAGKNNFKRHFDAMRLTDDDDGGGSHMTGEQQQQQQQDIDALSSDGALSSMESPEHLSSLRAGAEAADDFAAAAADEEEEVRMCEAIASAWDRGDHEHYPGPLSPSETVKAYLLGFLEEKLVEMQDKMPVDWESADLLVTYLSTLIKNNGVSE